MFCLTLDELKFSCCVQMSSMNSHGQLIIFNYIFITFVQFDILSIHQFHFHFYWMVSLFRLLLSLLKCSKIDSLYKNDIYLTFKFFFRVNQGQSKTKLMVLSFYKTIVHPRILSSDLSAAAKRQTKPRSK